MEAVQVRTKSANNFTKIYTLLKGLSAPTHEPECSSVQEIETISANLTAELQASPTTQLSPIRIVSQEPEVVDVTTPVPTTTDTTSPIVLPEATGRASTSGYQTITIDSHCSVVLGMPLPDGDLAYYKGIEDRLCDELAQCFRTEICQPEIFMASDRSQAVGPIIILTCWDRKCCGSDKGREKLRRKLQKRVHKLQSLRDCRFPCKVLIDNIYLSARTTAVSLSVSRQHLIYNTPVGLPLFDTVNGQKLCNLGGLIFTGDQAYGLTVAHPFDHTLGQSLPHGELDGRTTPQQEESDESENSDSNESNRSPSLVSIPQSEFTQHYPLNGCTVRERQVLNGDELLPLGKMRLRRHNNVDSSGPALDWALVSPVDMSLGLDLRLENRYYLEEKSLHVTIDTVAHGIIPTNTKVHIVCANGAAVEGVLGQWDVPLTVRNERFLVTQIFVKTQLGHGISGSWVVMQNSLVGVIIASRDFLPIVYMIPFERIMADIIADIGPFTLSKEARKAYASSQYTALSSGNTSHSSQPMFDGFERYLPIFNTSRYTSCSEPQAAEARSTQLYSPQPQLAERERNSNPDQISELPAVASDQRQAPNHIPEESTYSTSPYVTSLVDYAGDQAYSNRKPTTQNWYTVPFPVLQEISELPKEKPIDASRNRESFQELHNPVSRRTLMFMYLRIYSRWFLMVVHSAWIMSIIFLPLGLGLGFGLNRKKFGLTGGAIAGIVLGSAGGHGFLTTMVYYYCYLHRRGQRPMPQAA